MSLAAIAPERARGLAPSFFAADAGATASGHFARGGVGPREVDWWRVTASLRLPIVRNVPLLETRA
jgi:hypothetical protein